MKYGHPGFDGSKSSQDTDIPQREQTTMLDSSDHSRSISVDVRTVLPGARRVESTLLAGFALSFSKIFWDWAFVAVMAAPEQEVKSVIGDVLLVESRCSSHSAQCLEVGATCSTKVPPESGYPNTVSAGALVASATSTTLHLFLSFTLSTRVMIVER